MTSNYTQQQRRNLTWPIIKNKCVLINSPVSNRHITQTSPPSLHQTSLPVNSKKKKENTQKRELSPIEEHRQKGSRAGEVTWPMGERNVRIEARDYWRHSTPLPIIHPDDVYISLTEMSGIYLFVSSYRGLIFYNMFVTSRTLAVFMWCSGGEVYSKRCQDTV